MSQIESIRKRQTTDPDQVAFVAGVFLRKIGLAKDVRRLDMSNLEDVNHSTEEKECKRISCFSDFELNEVNQHKHLSRDPEDPQTEKSTAKPRLMVQCWIRDRNLRSSDLPTLVNTASLPLFHSSTIMTPEQLSPFHRNHRSQTATSHVSPSVLLPDRVSRLESTSLRGLRSYSFIVAYMTFHGSKQSALAFAYF